MHGLSHDHMILFKYEMQPKLASEFDCGVTVRGVMKEKIDQ